MKLSDIEITQYKYDFKNKSTVPWDKESEFIDAFNIPDGGNIHLKLPDGTEIIFTNSEWASIYIKPSEKG